MVDFHVVSAVTDGIRETRIDPQLRVHRVARGSGPMMPSDSLADLKTRIAEIDFEERARRLEMRLDFLEEDVEKLRGHVAMMQLIAGVQRDNDA